MTGPRLRLTGQGPHSRRIARYVADLADRSGLPARPAFRLRLAADEIVANIVVHGYLTRGGPIEVEGCRERDLVWVRIEDRAPPFDPGACRPLVAVPGTAPPARAAGQAHLDGDVAGAPGFGLILVRATLDEFVYSYREGRNQVLLGVRPDRDANARSPSIGSPTSPTGGLACGHERSS